MCVRERKRLSEKGRQELKIRRGEKKVEEMIASLVYDYSYYYYYVPTKPKLWSYTAA